MIKHSKKSKGAAVLEPMSEAPTEDEAIEKYIKPEPTIPLEPEEVGMPVNISFIAKHNKSATKLAAKHFKEGKVHESGAVLLPDGQIIRSEQNLRTVISPELNAMLKSGALRAAKPRRS